MLLRHHSKTVGAVKMATGCSDKGDMKEGCFNGRGEAASLAAVG